MATAQLKNTELEFKNSEGNTGKISFDANEELNVNRPVNFVQGIAANSVTISASGTLSAASIAFPKRWEFGKQEVHWRNGMSVDGDLSSYGNAGINTGGRNSYRYLTGNGAAQKGVFAYDFGGAPSFTDFELRFDMRISGSGADTIWAFANGSSSGHDSESLTGGHAGTLNHYSASNWFTTLYSGTSALVTDTDKHSYTHDNDTYKAYFLRRIGNVLTFGTVPNAGHSVQWQTSYTDTGTHPTGRYFGIGARTGAAASHHVFGYFEIRSFGSDDISNETDN